MKAKLTLVYIVVLSLLVANCSSRQVFVEEFKFLNKIEGSSKDFIKTNERIDNLNTFEKYFILTEKEVFIKVEASGYKIRKNLRKIRVNTPVFLIVERGVLSGNFKRADNITFSEIYRNFDQNWIITTENKIISHSDSDPVKKLIPGIYRIKFSADTFDTFILNLIVSTNKKIILFDRAPEVDVIFRELKKYEQDK